MGRMSPVGDASPPFRTGLGAILFLALAAASLACEADTSERPAAGIVTDVGPLHDARAGHEAVLLPDGRVLVVGGIGRRDRPLASAEVFDPTSDSLQRAGRLAKARVNLTATPLPDGRVLIVGGRDDRDLHALIELWDPTDRSFARAGRLSRPREHHTATVLPDGRVLIVGGTDRRGRAMASAEVWDAKDRSITKTGSLRSARYGHTASLLPDGRVLVIGGLDPEDRAEASAELWDPGAGRFARAGRLSSPRTGSTATTLHDGRVLVVGGGEDDLNPFSPDVVFETAEVWEPASERFRSAGDLSEGRRNHSATLLSDGEVLVVGGRGSGGATLGTLLVGDRSGRQAERWSPETETFIGAGRLEHRVDFHSAVRLPHDRVLIIGGCCADEGTLMDIQLWRPSTGRFETAGELSGGGIGHTATGLPDGRVLAVGGWDADHLSVRDVAELWTPADVPERDADGDQ